MVLQMLGAGAFLCTFLLLALSKLEIRYLVLGKSP